MKEGEGVSEELRRLAAENGPLYPRPYYIRAAFPTGALPRVLRDFVLGAAQSMGVPVLTIAYDGQQDPTLETRLEAFLHQARVYQQTRRIGTVPHAVAGAARRLFGQAAARAHT